MAGAAYTALVGARLDQRRNTLAQEIAASMSRTSIAIPATLALRGKADLVRQAEELQKTIGPLSKITIHWATDKSGHKQIMDSVAQFKNAVTSAMEVVTIKGYKGNQINPKGASGSLSQNFGTDAKQLLAVENQISAIEAKRVDLNKALVLSAEKFLAKTEGAEGKQVENARALAEQIKTTQIARENAVASFGKGSSQVKALDSSLDSLNNQFKIAQASINQVTGAFRSWTNSLGNAIKQTISYSISVGALYGALGQLKEGISYVAELNKQMTNIQVLQVEGGKSAEDISKLATGFNKLAREMGATTLEVSKGSTEWFRQGKTVAETQELLRSTLMLSKLGALETADATDFLTSTLNSFKLSADDAASVVDKLIAVDNIAATSAGELATALKYSSASAQSAGVTLETLVAYIGTISSVTRQSAESIGQALKTIFTRMQDIKAGKIDEDGIGINNVESALARVNIKLRDSQYEFRDMQDVLKDLSDVWSDLNVVEQANISKALAGIRQANMFKILMTNGVEVQKLHNAQMVAGGLAAQRYSIYLQGVEAAQNKMTASWEKMWTVSLNSDSIKFFYQLGSSLLDLISTFGGLPTVIGLVITSLGVFKSAAIASFVSMNWPLLINGITAVFVQFNTTLWATGSVMTAVGRAAQTMMGPIGWISLALGAIVLGLGYMSQTAERSAEELNKLSSELEASRTKLSGLNSELKSIKELGTAFEELKETTKETTEEKQKFLEVQNQIKELMPELAGSYDEEGNFILNETVNLQTLIDLKNEQIKLEKDLLEIKSAQAISAQKKSYEDEEKEIGFLKTQLETGMAKDGAFDVPYTLSPEALKASQLRLKELLVNHQLTAAQIKETFYQMSPDDQKLYAGFISGLKGAKDAVRAFDDWMINDAAETVDATVNEYKTFKDDITELLSSFSITSSTLEKSLEGTLDFSDIEKLISANEEYINAIRIINGQVVVNTEMLRTYDIQKADDILTTAMQNGATQKQIDILRAYRDALVNGTAYAPIFAKAQEDAQRRAEEAANKARDAVEKQLSAAKNLLDMVVSMIRDRKNAEKDALQGQLEGYKALIQAQKDALDSKKALDDYNKSVEKQSGAISTLQTQIDILKLDTSAEATAQRLQLEAELAEKKEALESEQSQHSIDIQKDSLDQQQDDYERMIDNRIASIDKYLAQSGRMMRDAQNMITKNSAKTYKQLMDWNMVYGDGLRSSVVSAWNEGYNGVVNFDSLMNQLNSINLTPLVEQIKTVVDAISAARSNAADFSFYMGQGVYLTNGGAVTGGGASAATLAGAEQAFLDTSTAGSTAKVIHSRHSGADSGFVQGLKSNEEFAKLMAGELVITPDQMDKFMNKTLPKVAQRGGGETMSIGKLLEITVQGNMDSSVVPQIKEIADKVVRQLNDNMKQRGFLRTTSLTSI
jgi:TP901 family phage tail tape measure protein